MCFWQSNYAWFEKKCLWCTPLLLWWKHALGRSGRQNFFASLFHTLLLRGNRQQWFRHSEYTVKSGNGNQASSTICVAIRTTENNFCLVYFLICFCPHPVGYAMFRTRSWILHKAFARSARIRPCMWRIQWRNVYAVRSGTLLLESQTTQWIFDYKFKRFPHNRQAVYVLFWHWTIADESRFFFASNEQNAFSHTGQPTPFVLLALNYARFEKRCFLLDAANNNSNAHSSSGSSCGRRRSSKGSSANMRLVFRSTDSFCFY